MGPQSNWIRLDKATNEQTPIRRCDVTAKITAFYEEPRKAMEAASKSNPVETPTARFFPMVQQYAEAGK